MKPITAPTPTARRVSRIPETCATAGVVDMTLRRWEKAGTFPRRFKLDPNSGPFGAVGHDYHEIQEHLEKRRASRDTTGATDA